MRGNAGLQQGDLIWKFCHENSETWQAEKQRIANEANRKRSEAAKEQHATSNPRTGETLVREQSVHTPEREYPERQTKAAASKTSPGTHDRPFQAIAQAGSC